MGQHRCQEGPFHDFDQLPMQIAGLGSVQGFADEFSYEFFEIVSLPARGGRALDKIEIVRKEDIRRSENQGPLDGILQFPDVARPCMAFEVFECGVGDIDILLD